MRYLWTYCGRVLFAEGISCSRAEARRRREYREIYRHRADVGIPSLMLKTELALRDHEGYEGKSVGIISSKRGRTGRRLSPGELIRTSRSIRDKFLNFMLIMSSMVVQNFLSELLNPLWLRAFVRFFHALWSALSPVGTARCSWRLSCFVAVMLAGSAMGQSAGKVTLKSGAVVQYSAVRLEGSEIVLTLPHGAMRLPQTAVTDESLRAINGAAAIVPKEVPQVAKEDVPVVPRATPAPTPTPVEKVAPIVFEDVVFPEVSEQTAVFEQRSHPELWALLPRALTARPETTAVLKTKLLEFTVSGRLHDNPQVNVQCLVPVDDNGRPLPGAADIVFYAPYPNQKDSVTKDPFVRALAEVFGMTVFSLSFKTDNELFGDLEKCYYYAESGSYEMVLQAWEKLLGQLQVPRKNLLIAANSAGSTMAQRFALLNADQVDAVSMIGGWRYEPILKPNEILWCVLCTRGDVRESANVELAAQARSHDVSMLHAVTPLSVTTKEGFAGQHTSSIFHHVASKSAFGIAQQFLATVRDRRNGGSKWKTASDWPLEAPSDAQWAVQKNAAGETRSENDRVFFPSEAFAATWMRNENRFLTIPGLDSRTQQILVRYPQGETPKGIIIYGGGATEPIGCGDDMDFLGLQGFIVVGAAGGEGGQLDDMRELIKWVSSREQWSAFPIFLLGLHESGSNFLTLLQETDAARVKSVAAIDARLVHADDARSATKQKVYVANIEESASARESSASYLKQARKAGVDASEVTAKPNTKLPRFELLEEIAKKFAE